MKITRSELYNLVWTEPVTKVSQRFGLSDVGLKKICDRFNIPTPGPGYWTLIQHGYKTYKTPLPKAKSGQLQGIEIRERSEMEKKKELPSELQKKVDSILSANSKVVVRTSLVNAHRFVKGWLEKDRRDWSWSRKDLLSPPYKRMYSSEIEKRQLRILSTLFMALEKNGFNLGYETRSGEEICIFSKDQKIKYKLWEKSKQIKVPLNEEDKKYNWSNREWKFEYEPTGNLSFKIDTWSVYKIKLEWIDKPEKRIEDCIREIVASFVVLAWEIEERREAKYQAQILANERRERDRIEEERHKQEQEKIKGLRSMVRDWLEARNIREFANEFKNAGPELVDKLKMDNESCLGWIRKIADQLDPFSTIEKVENE